MLKNPESRIQITKGIVAGGMVLVGLATGSNPFFTLLVSTSVGVGGNLLANVADKAFENWKNSWFTPNGSSNDHIRTALQYTFIEVIRQLESDWQKQHHYNYLKYKGEHERAKLSLTLIKELREDADKLFQSDDEWQELCKKESISKMVGMEPTELTTQEFLDQTIDNYFGIVEPLAEFSRIYVASNWIYRFQAYIQSDKGTSTWRACQQLWQTSLFSALAANQAVLSANSTEISEVKDGIRQITAWLKEWQEQLTLMPNETERNSIGDEALSLVLQPSFDKLQQQLESLAEDSQMILELFREKFNLLDSEQVIVNFLQKELLREQNVNLEQAGHQAEEDISLSKVFVDLPVSDRYTADPSDEDISSESLLSGIVTELVTAAQEPLDPQSLQIKMKLIEPGERWDKYHRLGKYVLIGGPGQGKTTIGQLACQMFRAAILRQRPQQQLSWKVLQVIPEIEALCEDEKIPLPQVPRIPFQIVLSDFAERLAAQDSKINSVLSYISARIRELTNQAIEVNDLRHWLGVYPWFLVLDGLDEVPASSNRDEVLRTIDDFWVDATGVNADILVIATTRPQGYNKDFAPNIYQHKYLVPLSNARATHYGDRLTKIRYKYDADRQRKIQERLKLALQEDTTARLMRSPLQVTIMTSLLERIGTPPQERWSLFSQYYSVIYQRETERNIPASRLLRRFEPDINAIHHRVGLLLQVESEHPERTASKLSLERFTKLVEMRLLEEGHDGEQLTNLKKEIIDAAMNRLVFLVGVEADEIGFEIRSLQEFMAAEALMDGGDEIVKERLEAIAPISHWRNVFLFAAGKCFVQKQYLRDTIYTTCASLNESKSTEYDIAESIKIGSQLALALLEDGISLRQPKFTKLLTRLAMQILELPPNEIHLQLSGIYKPEASAIFQEELTKFLGAPYPQNLGAWAVISTFANDPLTDKLTDKFWPRELEDQLYLLGAIVNESNGQRLTQRLKDTILGSSLESVTSQIHQRYLYNFDLGFPCKFLQGIRSWPVQIRTSEIQNRAWNFLLAPISFENKKTFTHHDMTEWGKTQTPHKDWLPFQAASRFLSNPTKESLSHGLKQLAPQIDLPLDPFYYAYSIPWPFLAVLKAANSEKELLEYATMIEQGKLGDLEEWSKAEERWRSQGVTINDFHYMTNDHWPYNRHIARVGFPFACESASITHLESAGKSLKAVHKIFSDLLKDTRYTRFHQILSDWIHFLIGFMSTNPNYANHFTQEDLIWLTKYAGRREWINIEVIITYWNVSQESDFINFVEKIGRQTAVFHHFDRKFDYQEIADVLSRAFVEDSDRLGILSVLANLFTYYDGVPTHIPSKLLEVNLAEAKYSTAQMILRLAQGENAFTELESMALKLADLSEDRPESINEVLRTIKQHKMVDNENQYFLSCLYAELKRRGNHKELQLVVAQIEDILSQRRSNLVDSWSVFKLPENLNKLITF